MLLLPTQDYTVVEKDYTDQVLDLHTAVKYVTMSNLVLSTEQFDKTEFFTELDNYAMAARLWSSW